MITFVPTLMSPHDPARMLRVSRATVLRLIAKGDLPAHKVGGQLRIDADELDAWLEAQRVGARPW